MQCLTVEEAAVRWDCDAETARTIIFGKDGFVARGFLARLDGNGTVTVTERGLEAAAAVEAWV